jgi:hypothetical protein
MLSSSANANYFIEQELWEAEIKENLFPALSGSFPHMRWITDSFPTGVTLTIPTTGRMAIRAYTEGEEITVEDPTLNEIQLTIDNYYQGGIGVTDKFKQDSYLAASAIATWRQDIIRGLKEKIEADVWNVLATDSVNGHTAADDNDIGGLDHRWGASGSSGIFDWNDFVNAAYVFDKHNVPKSGRVVIVDPKVARDLALHTATNSNAWYRQDVMGSNSIMKMGFGMSTYMGNFYGFDVYQSNMLSTMDTETVPLYGSASTIALTAPKVNLFLGLEAFFGAFRQNIELEQFRDHARKRDVMHACVRYGLRVFRPESVIAVLSV